MEKLLFLFAALFLISTMTMAQEKKVDFSGTWTLDVSKSKLDERARIESQVLTVTQTEKNIKVETATKRTPMPEGYLGGPLRRDMGGDTSTTYSLDGKETTVTVDSQMVSMPVTLKAKFEGSKLSLSQTRTFNGERGEMSMTTKEIWELEADGKTLTVTRESTRARGTNSSTMVFVKKS